MQVLLREAVVKLGKRGDVVRVADGYARNYLLPKGFAVNVTVGNKKQLEVERRNYEKRQLESKLVAEEAKGKLEQVELEIPKRAGDSGLLFGSVTAHEVARLLKKQGFEIERRRLELPTIKEVGEYHAKLRLHPEVTAKFKVTVVKEG